MRNATDGIFGIETNEFGLPYSTVHKRPIDLGNGNFINMSGQLITAGEIRDSRQMTSKQIETQVKDLFNHLLIIGNQK